MDVVIFDLDGTLIDTAPDIINALNQTLSDFMLAPIDADTGRRFIGNGARKLVEDSLTERGVSWTEDLLDDAHAKFTHYYTEKSCELSRVYPGVRDALDELTRMGFPLGVCTNKPQSLSMDVLKKLDLLKYFQAVLGGDALSERKPAASHILETAQRIAPNYKRAIMVGDSKTDVAAARNAGVPVVAVNYGYTITPAAKLGADAVIANMQELLSHIPQLWDTTVEEYSQLLDAQ